MGFIFIFSTNLYPNACQPVRNLEALSPAVVPHCDPSQAQRGLDADIRGIGSSGLIYVEISLLLRSTARSVLLIGHEALEAIKSLLAK